jgi:hypothetical protein
MRALFAFTIALAACTDLTASPIAPPATGSLSGTISGSSVGPLSGVTVTVTPGTQTALSAVTTSTGAYSLAAVPLGSGVITVSAFPNSCNKPSPASYTIAANATTIVNIQLSCVAAPTTGTVTGTVTNSVGGGIANAQVALTPSMGAAMPAVTTDANGNYTVSNVPAGGGSVAVTGVPASCAAPAAQPYSGLVAGQSVTVNVSVTCSAAEEFLVFNGTTSYVQVPSAPQLSVGAAGLTIAVWMRPDVLTFQKTEGSLANQQYVHWLGKGNTPAGDEEWTFRMYSQTNPAGPRANRISFYVFNATGGLGCGSYFQDSITAGQWIHVVGVVDAVAQTTAIYKNGVFRHSDSYSGTITPTPGAAPMGIGSKDLSSFFQGAIGPVRVWSRPLSATEIAALYTSNTVPSNGLVAAYAMTEGQGTTIVDSVAANNGTLYNTAWGTGPRQPVATAPAGTSGGGC